MDNDTPGVAERTLKEIRTWPPGCLSWLDDPSSCDAPVQKAGSRGAAHPPEALARVHSFAMAHTPLKMSIDEAHNEVELGGLTLTAGGNRKGGGFTEPQAAGLSHQHPYRTPLLRGIYFPQMGRFAWLKTILENRRTIFKTHKARFGGGLHAAVASVATEPVTEQNH